MQSLVRLGLFLRAISPHNPIVFKIFTLSGNAKGLQMEAHVYYIPYCEVSLHLKDDVSSMFQ